MNLRFLLLFFLVSWSSTVSAKVMLEVVCNNTIAFQTNFQKNFFDSYHAATDSMSSLFVVENGNQDAWTVTHFYPSNKSSLNISQSEGFIVKKTFHNLESNQGFIEGIMRSKKYTEVIAMHRSEFGDWAAQNTTSGNNQGNLFHRVYLYECITLVDNIK